MKKLLLKICLLVVAVIALNRVTYWILDPPFYWSNDDIVAKQIYLKENPGKYNTIFLGSSRIYRQIDPDIFDPIAGTKSYNLGIQGTFYPYHIYLLEELLESGVEMDRAIIELTKPIHSYQIEMANYIPVGDILVNLHTTKILVNADNVTVDEKVFRLKAQIYEFLVKMANSNMWDYHFDKYIFRDHLLYGRNGYYSLDEEALTDDFVKHRNEVMLKDTLRIAPLKEVAIPAYFSNKYYTDDADTYYPEIRKIQEKASQKGIKLYFVLPTRFIFKEAESVIPVFRKLDENEKLKITKPVLEQLFLVENSWDRGHLNASGAAIYTKALAEDLRRSLLQDKNISN